MDKYKEALNKAKKLMATSVAFDRFTIEHIFPELKESEDERIRKELIGFLRNIPNHNYTCEEMALWLEKQGTQPRYNIGDVICDLSCNEWDENAQLNYEIIDIKNGTYICDNGTIPVSQQDEYRLIAKKGEQKPVDKVNNDEDSVSNELREASFIFAAMQMVHKASPEERKLELIYSFEEGAKWQAVQKLQWKPSEEQMAALNNAILLNEDHYNGAVLSTLREQLMKLK